MFKLAAAALICALVLCLAAARRGGPHWLRFALASFGFFGVITAISWIVSPTGTAKTVSDDMTGGALLFQIVQGRGAVILPFGLAALFAAWMLPGRRSAAMAGPFAYNLIMSFEALRAQFTPLATPERWIYVALHSCWALSLLVYCLRIDWRKGRPTPAALLAAMPLFLGVVLVAAPSMLTGGNQSPMLLHATHAFGASLVGLGAVSYSFWSGLSEMPGRLLCIMAALLLAAISGLSGHWIALIPVLAWALAHVARRHSQGL